MSDNSESDWCMSVPVALKSTFIKSIFNFRLAKKDASAGSGNTYKYMFLDDISNYLLPIKEGKSDFRLKATGDMERYLREALSAYDRFNYEPLEDIFESFLKSISGEYVLDNLFIFVDFLYNSEGIAKSFKLIPLSGNDILTFPKRSLYRLPNYEDLPGQFKFLDSSKVHRIRLPFSLRRKTRKAIAAYAGMASINDARLDLVTKNINKNFGFNLAEQSEIANRHVLAHTKDIGWDGRGLFTDGLLLPEKCWRTLIFRQYIIKVRDSLITSLRKIVLDSAGRLGVQGDFLITDLLTIEDICKYEGALANGSLPLLEVMFPSHEGATKL